MLVATWWLGWTLTDNTLAMLLLSIPAWVGDCFPVWLKFKGGIGNGIIFGTQLYVGGPVIWVMALGVEIYLAQGNLRSLS